jgi:signal transduction histidine kinase
MDTTDYPISRLLPEDTQLEIKCTAVQPVVTFLRHTYGEAQYCEIISSTRMNPDYLAQNSNWISFDYMCRLFDKLVDVTGHPNAPFDVCQQHMARHRSIVLLAHLGSPATMYKLIARFNHSWDKICKYTILEEETNSIRLAINFGRQTQTRSNCLAIQGSLSAFPAFFGLPYARIEHEQCACEGADTCVYRVSWQAQPSIRYLWKAVGAGLLGATALLLLLGATPAGLLSALLVMLLAHRMGVHRRDLVKLDTIFKSNEEQSRCLLDSMQQQEELNANLQAVIEERTRELQATNTTLRQTHHDLQRTQLQKIQQERQAAVGILAAGIAHEINSPLNGIGLSMQAFEESDIRDPELSDLVTTARDGVRKCKRLVSQLLSFSREQPGKEVTDLSVAVRQAVRQFEVDEDANRGVTVELTIEPDLPTLPMPTLQLEQIVLNLLSNAGKALGGQACVNVALAAADKGVRLTVADQGSGMPRDVARHIFDPFFKGRQSGGLGLGLSITRDLVQRNGGTISCISEEGRGTTFQIEFPVPEGTTHA